MCHWHLAISLASLGDGEHYGSILGLISDKGRWGYFVKFRIVGLIRIINLDSIVGVLLSFEKFS